MIQDMAMAQKKKAEDAKKTGNYQCDLFTILIMTVVVDSGHMKSSNYGGFMGVDQLASKAKLFKPFYGSLRINGPW